MKRHFSILPVAAVIAGSLLWFANGDGTPVYSSEKSDTTVYATATKSPSPSPAVESAPQPAQSSPTATAQPVRAAAVQSTPAIKGNSISIPSIGFQAPIVEVGLTAGNAIDVPAGMQVGHWNGSARPGTSGAVFLDGHVDGIFVRLSRVAVGHTISINYDNQTFMYRVVHTEVVLLDGIDMNRALSVFGNAGEGLNMMTCAGTYLPTAGTYDKRLVVYTVRV
jgi:LPXTG-site transpeptidase (sortase) family protein